jgi:hypothetical protein
VLVVVLQYLLVVMAASVEAVEAEEVSLQELVVLVDKAHYFFITKGLTNGRKFISKLTTI